MIDLMYLPTDRAVRATQLDLDPSTVGTRMPTEAPVVGEVAEGWARCCRC